MGRRVVTSSAEETIALGRELAQELKGVVCLFGELGAGKTTLIKGIISGATGTPIEEISSPTFVYLHNYEGVHHFDLYRLPSAEAFLELGFDEYLDGRELTLIEWSERIEGILPKRHTRITLSHNGENERHVELEER